MIAAYVLTMALLLRFCSIAFACKKMGMPVPARPKPLYSFFPIYSPFKVDDNDGFNLGEDNRIKSIGIKDGALHFEVRDCSCDE